jgi:transglutaminase-like putative cysteine protease
VLTAPPRQAPPPPGSHPGDRARATASPASPDGKGRPAATLALGLLTLASALGLARVFSGHRWWGPVLLTVVVVHGVAWLLRRAGAGAVAAALTGLVAAALMATWTVLGHWTYYGLPTGRTWHQAALALGHVGNQFATLVTPVAPTRGFLLLAVAGAGLAAVTADWLAFGADAPLAAVVPGLATWLICAATGQGPGRAPLVALEVAAVCVFLMAERVSAGSPIWFAGVGHTVGRWVVSVGGVVTAVAVAAAVAVTPALAARDGSGALGWRSPNGAGGERIVPNPLVDLQTRLTSYANTPVFQVISSVPSYWRLTSLDSFNGTTWTYAGSYRGFGGRLPGAPAGSRVRTVTATFTVQQLNSVWLPAQFDPVSVRGVRQVTYDPGSNSLLTAGSTSNGLTYQVTSYQLLDTLTAASLRSAPPLLTGGAVVQDLQLPLSVQGRITDLAAALTLGQPTEYDKALAIETYLRSSIFTYSLHPRSDGSGNQALYNFLFVTRSGYCQQFAGAFAVLARAAGLPTRLAVGFATGSPVVGGAFQVFDRDAHTWPEVWFGPRYGWVPFEPTPGFSVPGTAAYARTSGDNTGLPEPTPTTVAPPSGGTAAPAPHTTAPRPRRTVPTTLPLLPASGPSGGSAAWWLVLPGLAGAWVAATGGIPLLTRRYLRRRAGRRGPAAVALNAWSEAATELAWQGVRRRPYETDGEFAGRATATLRRLGLAHRWQSGGLTGLAGMAGRASFAEDVPAELGAQARAAAAEVEATLRAATPRRRRILRALSPAPDAWRRLTAAVRPRPVSSGPGPRTAGAAAGPGIRPSG